MNVTSLNDVLADLDRAGKAWKEFLRVDSMSMGVYRLRSGELDEQQPHTEDEVYYVVSGRAKFVYGSETRDVKASDVLYVDRNLPHRFVEITEELTLLVFFAPPENSLKRR
jgi:mannose-6-phosphate isomerase-like protein (cupin superfamily)